MRDRAVPPRSGRWEAALVQGGVAAAERALLQEGAQHAKFVTLLREAVCPACTAGMSSGEGSGEPGLACAVGHHRATRRSCDGPGAAAQGRKEDLAGEARLLREGAHAAALERAARAQRAAALCAKFAALRSKHAAALDDDGQPRSQASPGAFLHASCPGGAGNKRAATLP